MTGVSDNSRHGSAEVGFDGAPADWLSLVRQLIRVTRHVRRRLADVGGRFQLGDTELLVLFSCAAASDEGITQIALAEEVGVSTAQMSGIVERLKGRGWLSDRRGTRDRRRVYWRLSPTGVAKLPPVLAELSRLFEDWSRQLPLPQTARVMSDLRLLESLDQRCYQLRLVQDCAPQGKSPYDEAAS